MKKLPKKDLSSRLKKVRGQIEGVMNMIEDERDAKEIVQQITAARSALKKVHCVVVANRFSNASLKKGHLDELIEQMHKAS